MPDKYEKNQKAKPKSFVKKYRPKGKTFKEKFGNFVKDTAEGKNPDWTVTPEDLGVKKRKKK